MNVSAVSSASSSAYAPGASRQAGGSASGELDADQAAQVAKLKQIDRQVRQHEMAHVAAGAGVVTSGASFTYEKGPDGQNYVVAGEVGIDTSPGRTPEETIARARRIRSAALAPADPSPQDRSVAAAATQMEVTARMELAQQRAQAASSGGGAAAYLSAPGSASGSIVDIRA